MTPEMLQQQAQLQLKDWQTQVNKLCFDIFFNTDAGKQLLFLWEQRWFYSPTADPSTTIDYARFNEGRNSHIRSIRASAYAAMNSQPDQTIQQELEP